MLVKTRRRSTATPAPSTIPQIFSRAGKLRQAIAMTTALSPDSRILMKMICSTAAQSAAPSIVPMLAWSMAPHIEGCRYCAVKPTAATQSDRQRHKRASSADDFIARKELRDFLDCGVGGIRAVHGVLADRFRNFLADGARCRLRRIGGAHQIAVGRDRIVAFEYLHHDRAGNHEVNEFAKERTLAVYRIECLGLLTGHADPLLCNDTHTGFFDHGVDRARHVAGRRVRFDNR